MDDSIEARLEREAAREVRRERGRKAVRILLDSIAVFVLVFVVFWVAGGHRWVTGLMPDKPVSEFFYAVGEGGTDALKDYLLTGDEDTLRSYAELREAADYRCTTLYRNIGNDNLTGEEYDSAVRTVREYAPDGAVSRAVRVHYSVRITAKGDSNKRTEYEGQAVTVRVNDKWYMLPGSISFREVK